jgi:hypothetical protein
MSTRVVAATLGAAAPLRSGTEWTHGQDGTRTAANPRGGRGRARGVGGFGVRVCVCVCFVLRAGCCCFRRVGVVQGRARVRGARFGWWDGDGQSTDRPQSPNFRLGLDRPTCDCTKSKKPTNEANTHPPTNDSWHACPVGRDVCVFHEVVCSLGEARVAFAVTVTACPCAKSRA